MSYRVSTACARAFRAALSGEHEPREPLRLCVSVAVNNVREIARHEVRNFLLLQQQLWRRRCGSKDVLQRASASAAMATPSQSPFTVVLPAMLGYDGAAGGRPSLPIGHLERGLKKNRSLPTLKKLARALGVPVTELLK